MKSLPSGIFDQVAAADHLWRAYRAVRRGKRRGPVMAEYERNADLDILALSRELINWFPRSSVGIHIVGTSGSGMDYHAGAW